MPDDKNPEKNPLSNLDLSEIADFIEREESEVDPGIRAVADQYELEPGEISDAIKRIEEIPKMSPGEIETELREAGYRGQDTARRAGCTLAYRHMQRIRRAFIDGRAPERFPDKEHYLFLGATGSGKTFLVELLFREILKVPTLIADATRFTETGYIGDDVPMLLSHVFENAGRNRAWAACGVICLDEFDKLATSRSSARFAGEGTTKDVSGFGVQRGLLTLLSGKSATFPEDFGFSAHGTQVRMPLNHMMFIACGAFSGLPDTALLRNRDVSIGFGGSGRPAMSDTVSATLSGELLENTKAFSDYGILPELIGRFSRLVAFQPLAAEVLRQILEDTVLDQYRDEFKDEGVELRIDPDVIGHIVDEAKRRETGARGIKAALVPHLEEAAFQSFGRDGDHVAHLKLDRGQIVVQVS